MDAHGGVIACNDDGIFWQPLLFRPSQRVQRVTKVM